VGELVQQNRETSVYQTEMFRPDPNTELVDEAIAKLTEVLTDVPPGSPRARKLTETIRGLQEIACPAVGRSAQTRFKLLRNK
jgi:hypothetical protein